MKILSKLKRCWRRLFDRTLHIHRCRCGNSWKHYGSEVMDRVRDHVCGRCGAEVFVGIFLRKQKSFDVAKAAKRRKKLLQRIRSRYFLEELEADDL